MTITQRRMTLEKFLTLPERKPALEFEDGVVTQKVSPMGPHSILQYRVAEFFNRSAEPRKLGFAFPELRTTFSEASRVPDVAFFVWDRIPRDARGRPVNDFFIQPDVAIEILSPGQTIAAQSRRCRRFVDEGVRVALLVNPRDDSIVEFRPGREAVTHRGDDEIDLSDVLPEFRFTVQALFDSIVLR